jgi:hypothetical protein
LSNLNSSTTTKSNLNFANTSVTAFRNAGIYRHPKINLQTSCILSVAYILLLAQLKCEAFCTEQSW